MVKYCFDRYKTQEMHDKAVDNFLSTHKVFPDWFVTSRMFKNLSNALFADDNILFFDEDSGSVTFSVDEWVFLLYILIILIMLIFMKMILKLLFMLDVCIGIKDINNMKHFKK